MKNYIIILNKKYIYKTKYKIMHNEKQKYIFIKHDLNKCQEHK